MAIEVIIVVVNVDSDGGDGKVSRYRGVVVDKVSSAMVSHARWSL
jgi:hypothetical protein